MGPRDRAHSRRGVSRCGCDDDDDDDDMKMNDFQMMRHVFMAESFVYAVLYCFLSMISADC
jgi:hypothetical protein